MGSQMRPGGMDLTWLLDDFEVFLTAETDFRGEAANSEAAACAFAHRGDVFVPPVLRQLSSARVLTTAFVGGLLRIDDGAALRAAGLRAGDVGSAIASAFAETALQQGWIHGDPHGGNVYVTAAPPQSTQWHAPLAAVLAPRLARVAALLSVSGCASASAAVTQLCAALPPAAALPRLVLLDHGLHHRLDDTTRVALCHLVLSSVAARPAGMRAASAALARGRPGGPPAPPGVARFFPLALSHYFVFGFGFQLTPAEVAAARSGRMPPGLTMTDLSDFLTGLHGSGGNVLGIIHSLGYVRGLLNSLPFPERRRLRALARAAALGARVIHAPPPGGSGAARPGGVAWAAGEMAALQADCLVWLLFPLLALLALLAQLVDVAALLCFFAACAWAAAA